MYYNDVVAKARNRIETDGANAERAHATGVGRSVRQTVVAATVVTIAPVAVVAAVSYPAAAVAVAAATGIVAFAKRHGGVQPPDATRQSESTEADARPEQRGETT